MPYEFIQSRRVEFAETDMAGIAHYSEFFRYMEETEHAFFRSLGFSIDTKLDVNYGWPRVHASCDFKQAVRFEDELEIRLLVREKKSRSIDYAFVFRKLNDNGVICSLVSTALSSSDADDKSPWLIAN